jgi:transmembrane sensor
MGTVFNVTRDSQGLEVAVSEGAVLYNPGREAKDLRPGMALRREEKGGKLWVGRTDTATVGAWRQGRLVYAAAPASRIAADLSRNLGVPVTAKGAAAVQPFSGVIFLDGKPADAVERSAALLGLTAVRSGPGWTLTKGHGAAN